MKRQDLARRAIALLPARVRARLRATPIRTERMSVRGALGVIRGTGFSPASVIDVGAAYGDWSAECQTVFTDARYLLFEPLEEYYTSARSQRANLRRAVDVRAAAAATSGALTMNVHDDLVGSSLLGEREGAAVDGTQRTVPVVTVDDAVTAHGMPGPYLLKLDVQGAELDVLAGAQRVLSEAEAVILEVSLFGFFIGGPQFADVVRHMEEIGFVPYDLLGPLYRPLDGALAQMDVVFARADGALRRQHVYATARQRGL